MRIRPYALAFAALLALIVAPWPFTVALTLASALWVPLLPFAIGALADALYYARAAQAVPFYAALGAALTLIAYLVRSRLATGIIGE